MAKTIQRTASYPTAAGELYASLHDPATLQHRHAAQGALESKVHEIERSATRLVQRVDSREYAHTKTGGLDRSKIESTATTYEWDLAGRRGQWHYRGTQGDRIHIGGTFAVRERGAESELETRIEVRVDLPLIGRVIEGLIASDIEKFLVSYRPPTRAKGSTASGAS